MKTIYTCLPIYDRIAKQCFQRSKGVSGDKGIVVPTITPRHRLPAFQWNAETDNMGDVTNIELIDVTGTEYNVPTPFTGWHNTGWDISWSSEGLNFIASETGAHTAICETTGIYYGFTGEIIRFHCVATISAGTPQLKVYENGALTGTYNLANGVNDITHTLTADGTYVGGGLYFTITSDFALAQDITIEQTRIDLNSLNKYFTTLPADVVEGTDTYYIYAGDTLEYLLPEGVFYLRITMENGHVLYSDWFAVSCVFENLITEWTNDGYNTFQTDGTAITFAEEAGADGRGYSDSFDCIIGEEITVIFFLTAVGGELPTLRFTDGVTDQDETTTAGLNEFTFTAVTAGSHNIEFIDTGVAAFMAEEVLVMRQYSENYLIFNFEHSCNLGDILYEENFQQALYLETENMEPSFPYIERGAENGYAQFVPTFQRQDKIFSIKTLLIPQYIVDVLHRLKLHDTIILTDLVGDSNTVEEIEIEHEWQFEDKYYALATITVNLGDGIVVTGCCTAINECS